MTGATVDPTARKAVGYIERGGDRVGHAVLVDERHAVTCAHNLNGGAEPPTVPVVMRFPLLDLDVTARVVDWRPYADPVTAGSDLALLAFEGGARAPDGCHAELAPAASLRPGDDVVTLDFLGGVPSGNARAGAVHDPHGDLIALNGAHFVERGMSGTGLFQPEPGRRLLGLVAGLPIKEGQPTGYAIPAEQITLFVERHLGGAETSTPAVEHAEAIRTYVALVLQLVGDNMRPLLADFAERASAALSRPPSEWRDEDIDALCDLQIEIRDEFSSSDEEEPWQPVPAAFRQVLARLSELLGLLAQASGGTQLVALDEAMRSLIESALRDIEEVEAAVEVPEAAVDALAQLGLVLRAALAKNGVHLDQLGDRTQRVRQRGGEPFERGARGLMACIGLRAEAALPGTIFTNSIEPWAPELVVIPAGTFMMGSPEHEEGRDNNEGPRHEVSITRRFALGRYAVTFDEYDRYCEDFGRERPDDQGWGRGRRPVINVSWKDAQAYVEWLNGEAEGGYRLPSEAEWEYACRADTETASNTGVQITEDQANFGGDRTVVVGSFRPNSFGLHDMHGNVWEWVEDVWHDDYREAPDDGSTWVEAGDQRRRVLRGGSWDSGSRNLRAAVRGRGRAGNRSDHSGFRLARTLSR